MQNCTYCTEKDRGRESVIGYCTQLYQSGSECSKSWSLPRSRSQFGSQSWFDQYKDTIRAWLEHLMFNTWASCIQKGSLCLVLFLCLCQVCDTSADQLVNKLHVVCWTQILGCLLHSLHLYRQDPSSYGMFTLSEPRPWPRLSDREDHGHKAVVYKSHFLPLRHSVVTETPARYLANKPRLHQRPSSLFFMPPRHGGSSDLNWDLRTISLGCVSHCQSIGRVERSLRDLPFHTLIAGSFLHAEQVCLLAEASASRSARYSRRIVARDISVYQVVCFQITIIKQGISHSISNSSH